MPTVPDAPPIGPFEDDLVTREYLAEWFGVAQSTVDQWRYGRQGRMPPMPYLRIGNTTYFSKTQLTWWLNQYQALPDPYFIERMRRIKEGIKVGKPRKKRS